MEEEPRFKSLAEVPEVTEEGRKDSESSYRRGYCQGIAAAIREMERGRDVGELCDSAYRWRWQGSEDGWHMTKPPGSLPPHKRP